MQFLLLLPVTLAAFSPRIPPLMVEAVGNFATEPKEGE